MRASPDHEGIRKALKISYYLSPLLTLVFFVSAATISVCALQTISVKTKYQRVSRKIILWLMSGIAATYIAEAAIETTTLLDGREDWLAEIRNVYSLASVIVWFILIASLLDSAYPVWYPYYGSWLVALVVEIVLITLSVVDSMPTTTIDSVDLGLAAARVGLLISLLLFLFGRRITAGRYNQGDEENQPLLAPSHVQGSSEDSGVTQGSTQYGSISTDGSGAGKPDWETRAKERERKARQRVEDRLRDDGNWWTYAKGFSVFIPFVWPSKDYLLQLCILGVSLCLLAGRVLNVLIPRQVGIATNSMTASKGHVPWLEISLYILYSWLNSGAGIFALKNYFWLPVEQYAYKAISTASYNHVMNLSSDFHDSKRSGELYQTINLGHSVNNLLETILFQILPMLVDLAVAIAYLYYLFGAYMALIVAAVVVAYLWASTYFNARQISVRRGLIGNLHKEWQIMYDTMGSWQTVSYFNRIKHEQERYSSAVEAHMRSQWTYTALAYLAKATQSSVLTVGLLGASFLAAYQVIHGNQSVGGFVILLTYWAQLSGPLTFFGSAFRQISKDFLDAEQLLQVLQYKPSVADRAGAKPLVLGQGEIEFNNVHFSYDSQRQTLKGISFRALPGQTVALVGETGGGKSTILKLLFRFYDVAQGSIKIDGQDIRDVTLESLRKNLGMVPQDPSLFNETIMNNIRYARLDATDEEVYDACKAAAIHDKIVSFTDGYQSTVGERGVKLSGGELQRIAIARAILKNPNIILLDEATSSVDTETEMHIQEAFRKLTIGRTTFVIAHRLSTIMKADRIIVIKNGEILEQGSHDDLFRAKGKYYNLWSKQIVAGKTRDRSKSPKKGKRATIINNLDGGANTQNLLETGNSTHHGHRQENMRPARSQDQAQKNSNHRGNNSAENQNLALVKYDKAGKGRLSSFREKFWRPDAPEFIPHYLRTSFGQRGETSHQPKRSSERSNSGEQGERPAGSTAVVGNKITWNGTSTSAKDDKGKHEFSMADVREDGNVSGKAEREKKRRWRKRKSRDQEEPVRQDQLDGVQAPPGENASAKNVSQQERDTFPSNNNNEELGIKPKRQRTNRRAQSKSDPTGQGRSQTDGATEMEPRSTGSSNGQPVSSALRRVSAPSDPPSGKTITDTAKYVRRRRRRQWRSQNRETSGTQSTRSTGSWSMDSPPVSTPVVTVTSPSNGAQASNGSAAAPSGGTVRFAAGS